MAKKVVNQIKLQIPAGKATPAPPVGTILGPVGINLGEFCTKYNEATRDKMGDILPVVISIYDDRSFDFILKTPPAAFLLKKIAKVKKGSATGAKDIVATITKAQLREIAEIKMPDLNAYDIEAAMKIVAGTAHNMGIVLDEERAEMEEHFAAQKAEEAKEAAREAYEAEQAAKEAEANAEEEPEEATDEQADEEKEETE